MQLQLLATQSKATNSCDSSKATDAFCMQLLGTHSQQDTCESVNSQSAVQGRAQLSAVKQSRERSCSVRLCGEAQVPRTFTLRHRSMRVISILWRFAMAEHALVRASSRACCERVVQSFQVQTRGKNVSRDRRPSENVSRASI